jgi:predicted DsbA family dithiol-disulfide isomerase
MTAIDVDFYFDAICPWSFIGKRRLERAIAARPDLDVVVRWQPFLLNPELPPEGLDRTAYLIRKFGSEQRIARAIGSVAEAGQSVAIEFAFDRIHRTPNTLNAHALVRLAAPKGKAGDMVEALFQAYFVAGEDIGDRDVLFALGQGLGLDEATMVALFDSESERVALFESNARAHRLGINGSPSLVFDGGLAISGAQEPAVLTRMMDVAAAGAPSAA